MGLSVDEGSADAVSLRSKTNPFQDVPHDRKAVEVKEGLLQRKIHADVDGKRSEFLGETWFLPCLTLGIALSLIVSCDHLKGVGSAL